MVKKKVIERVKPGLFVRIPESVILDKQQYTEDAILIATKATKKSFLSHYTALTLHGLSERYTTQIYATTTTHQRNIQYNNITINYIQIIPKKYFGTTVITYSNYNIRISEVERTIIDIINKPKYAGGWTETINCLKNLDKIDFKKLITYLKKYNNKTTARKIGYLFENLSNLSPSKNILKQIKNLSGSNELYFDTTKKGIYNSDWNLIVPKNITELLHAY
jgi:predicted transcriptional regulator of viral defense system